MRSIKDRVTKKLKAKSEPVYNAVVSVRLPKDVLKAIDDIQNETDTKRSEIIVELLREALKLNLK